MEDQPLSLRLLTVAVLGHLTLQQVDFIPSGREPNKPCSLTLLFVRHFVTAMRKRTKYTAQALWPT